MSGQTYLPTHLQGFGDTIFATMTRLAEKHNAINLGQGFPDFDGPDFIKQAAIEAIEEGWNQYAPVSGVHALKEAIARHQKRYYDLDYEPATEVLITHGATGGLAAALIGICEPGDEVVMFEPFYDSYRAVIAMAHAVPKLYTLEPPDFAIDPERLAKLVTPKTRAILINSPHNPTGRVLSREDLEVIARLAIENDLIVISDEVYEHMVFDGEHIPIATLDGMRDRTITISSVGKTFSLTGWKVGWCIANPELIQACCVVHQFLSFSVVTPQQYAAAKALDLAGEEYYDSFIGNYRQRCDTLCSALEGVGLDVSRPQGSYFVLTDIRSIGEIDGYAFCNDLPKRIGVGAIPAAAFYEDKEVGLPLVRFTFCKSAGLLEQATQRIARLTEQLVVEHGVR